MDADTARAKRNMKLYTKTGDTGQTSILKGKRVLKSELLIEANGAIDEASSFVGWCREVIEDEKVRTLLSLVQHDFYEIMSFLAGASFPETSLKKRISVFETYIDKTSSRLPKLERFILPQGGETSTRLHIVRTVVRSAERRVVRYAYEKGKFRHDTSIDEMQEIKVVRYLNRLSDMLFTMARHFAQVEKET